MNLRQIEVFRAVMITGSISGAAKLLFTASVSPGGTLHAGVKFNEPGSMIGARGTAIGWGMGGALGVNLLSVSLDRDTFFYSDRLTSMETAGNSSTTELLHSMEQMLAQSGASPDLQSAGAHWNPKVMVPRQRRDTWRPVRPRRVYCMVRLLPCAESPAHAGVYVEAIISL